MLGFRSSGQRAGQEQSTACPGPQAATGTGSRASGLCRRPLRAAWTAARFQRKDVQYCSQRLAICMRRHFLCQPVSQLSHSCMTMPPDSADSISPHFSHGTSAGSIGFELDSEPPLRWLVVDCCTELDSARLSCLSCEQGLLPARCLLCRVETLGLALCVLS